jgi:hypothetical protein
VTAVRAVSPAIVPSPAGSTQSGAATAPASSLLPEPATSALAGADPLSMLYLFESNDQQLDVDEGTKQISALETDRHQALQREQQAIAQALAAEHDHSFWDDLGSVFGEVAKVAAVVVSVAAAVVSCGATAPIAALAIAGAVLSTASFVDGEFHVLRSLNVDAGMAGWIDTGMAIGGAVCSALGATAATGAMGLVERGGTIAAGAGAVGEGATRIEAGRAQGRADQAAADQIAAQAVSDQSLRRTQIIVDDIRGSDEAARRALGVIANTDAIRNQTAETAAAAVQG